MALFDSYRQRAGEYFRQLRQAKEQVQQDKMLSVEGKRQKLDELQARYNQQVAALRDEAEGRLTSARGGAEKQLQLLAEKRLEERRALLGDLVLADIYRRQIETSDPETIARAYEQAPTLWEKQIIASYGEIALEQMMARTDSDMARMTIGRVLSTLAQAEPEDVRQAKGELNDIDADLRRLDELDMDTYSTVTAGAMGVDVRYFADVMVGAE